MPPKFLGKGTAPVTYKYTGEVSSVWLKFLICVRVKLSI
jgi:hypothetical protein